MPLIRAGKHQFNPIHVTHTVDRGPRPGLGGMLVEYLSGLGVELDEVEADQFRRELAGLSRSDRDGGPAASAPKATGSSRPLRPRKRVTSPAEGGEAVGSE